MREILNTRRLFRRLFVAFLCLISEPLFADELNIVQVAHHPSGDIIAHYSAGRRKDQYLVRLDGQGNILWSRHLDFASQLQPLGLIVTKRGEIHMSGTYGERGKRRKFVAKFDGDGHLDKSAYRKKGFATVEGPRGLGGLTVLAVGQNNELIGEDAQQLEWVRVNSRGRANLEGPVVTSGRAATHLKESSFLVAHQPSGPESSALSLDLGVLTRSGHAFERARFSEPDYERSRIFQSLAFEKGRKSLYGLIASWDESEQAERTLSRYLIKGRKLVPDLSFKPAPLGVAPLEKRFELLSPFDVGVVLERRSEEGGLELTKIDGSGAETGKLHIPRCHKDQLRLSE